MFITPALSYQTSKSEDARDYAKASSGAKAKYGETIPFALEAKFALKQVLAHFDG